MQVHSEFKRVIERLVSAGWQLSSEAFDLIQSSASRLDHDRLADELLAAAEKQTTGQRLIGRDIVEEALDRLMPPAQSIDIPEPVKAEVPLAAEIESNITVVRDPSSAPIHGGSIEEFSLHFRDRFMKLREILRRRADVRDAGTISNALSAQQNARVKMIGMIMDKRERGNRLFLTIDDLEDTAYVLVQTDRDRQLYEAARRAPLDQVVCIEAVRSRGSLLVAQRITLPDIPERKPKGADEEIYAVLLSDIHVGSRKFLEDAFRRAILWLNAKVGTPQQVYVARRTKYVVIAGDLVDGIGVYPRQEDELSIPDIYEQYKIAAKFIEQIPDHVEVVLIPGNHDAVRQALPQPAILKEFAEPVYEARAVTSLGNPCEVELHGVRFLLHHGRSLEDLLTSAPGMTFNRPEKAMELQLKCRHLAPEYGNRTSIAPSRVDHLVVDEPPDVFHSGHIHVFGHENYRGTLIVNSGAWQAQTDYQQRLGLEPTPGLLPVVNLQTLRLSVTNFMSTAA
jgi:DNA polymerase II small subunit